MNITDKTDRFVEEMDTQVSILFDQISSAQEQIDRTTQQKEFLWEFKKRCIEALKRQDGREALNTLSEKIRGPISLHYNSKVPGIMFSFPVSESEKDCKIQTPIVRKALATILAPYALHWINKPKLPGMTDNVQYNGILCWAPWENGRIVIAHILEWDLPGDY